MAFMTVFLIGVAAGAALANYNWRSNSSKVMYHENGGKLYKVLSQSRFDYLESVESRCISQNPEEGNWC